MKLFKGLELELSVVDLAFGGKGVAKVNLKTGSEFTVFIDGALPGQRVLAKISVLCVLIKQFSAPVKNIGVASV